MYNTEHKKKLITLFEENQNEVYSAPYLVQLLKDSMNKATVYRQLKAMEEKNLIRKTFNEEEKTYEYQYAIDCNNHLHLKCIKCGRIIHLKCTEANAFISHIGQVHGFSVNPYNSTIQGICRECSSC